MSVGRLTRRFRGAVLTNDFGPAGTALVNFLSSGAYVIADGDSVSTVVVDTDGFAGQGIVGASYVPDPWSLDNYSGNGRLVIPPGLGGLYRVSVLPRVFGVTFPCQWNTDVHVAINPDVDDYGPYINRGGAPLAQANDADPAGQVAYAVELALREGDEVAVSIAVAAGAPNAVGAGFTINLERFALEYLGRA